MKKFLHSALLFVATCLFAFGQSSVRNPIREYRTANDHKLLSDFVEMLAIPNVASDTRNINRNADFLLEAMKRRGLNPRLLKAADRGVPPIVYGESATPGAKQTLIFYAHYDG